LFAFVSLGLFKYEFSVIFYHEGMKERKTRKNTKNDMSLLIELFSWSCRAVAGHATGYIGIAPEADGGFVPQTHTFTVAALAGRVSNRAARIKGQHDRMGRLNAGI
jgi:hypothetical protein